MKRRTPASRDVARAWWLDLHDVGAEIAQHGRRKGARERMREIEYPDIIKRHRHRVPPALERLRCHFSALSAPARYCRTRCQPPQPVEGARGKEPSAANARLCPRSLAAVHGCAKGHIAVATVRHPTRASSAPREALAGHGPIGGGGTERR